MTIHVLLFASIRDRAGASALDLELPASSTVQNAIGVLAERFPPLLDRLGRVMYAVNQQYSDSETVLNDGDELALIPPVSGG